MLTNLFSEFTDLNPSAAIEHVVLTGAVYNNITPDIQRAIDALGGGSIVRYFWHRDISSPDYLIWRKGNDWSIVFDGSNTFTQIYGILVGTGPTGVGKFGQRVHRWVREKYDAIEADVFKNLPRVLKNGRMFVAGHSLGGMMAHAFSYELLSRYGTQVQLCAFGAPKWFLGAPNPRYPGKSAFLWNGADPAPYWPFSVPLPTNSTWVQKAIAFTTKASKSNWEQTDPWFHLTDANHIERVEASTFNPLLGGRAVWSLISSPDHFLKNYFAKLRTICLASPHPPQTDAIIAIGDAIFPLPDSKSGVTNPNPADFVDLTALNAIDFPNNPGTIVPADIPTLGVLTWSVGGVQRGAISNIGDLRGFTMAAPSGYFKITMMINALDLGRSESHVLKTNTWADAQKRAFDLASKRSYLLGNTSATSAANKQTYDSPQIQYIRISDALNPKSSYLIDLTTNTGYFGAAGNSNYGADAMSTSLSLQLPGTDENTPNPGSRSTLSINGQPDAVVVNRLYNGSTVTVTAGKSFTAYMIDYLNELIKSARVWGFMGLSLAQATKTVTDWALGAGNTWILTVPAHGYDAGDKIRLTRVNVKGFAGTYIIKVTDVNTISLVNQPPIDLQVPTSGKVQRVQLASGKRVLDFYQYQAPPAGIDPAALISIRKKDPARRFSKQSFKKRARRIR